MKAKGKAQGMVEHYVGTVGEHPTKCEHCGGQVKEVGLVAPKCVECGHFSVSHITFEQVT